jgi:hypothetical protein
MRLRHKDIVLPEVDLSHDEGSPEWHAAGGQVFRPVYREDGTIRHYRYTGLPPGHYREYYQDCIVQEWDDTVARYEDDCQDVHAAWWYLAKHPVFWRFDLKRGRPGYPVNHVSRLEADCSWVQPPERRFLRTALKPLPWLYGSITIDPHLVDPVTPPVEGDQSRNTALEWWYEFGPHDLLPVQHGSEPPCQASWHDYPLDGGAPTYEKAVLEIAAKVWVYYGNDRRVIDTDEWRRDRYPDPHCDLIGE